jgi:leucyl aminopeptidase
MLLAVNRGSDLEPRFIHMTYRPEGDTTGLPTVAFVGKGLTFDAGGYCLKPPGAIDDMKIDMAGSAAVIGAMKAIKGIAPRAIVHGFIPSTENLINGSAYKTGDVLRGRNGKTVEILNTDAEGRLILADALTYAVEQGADEIIDLATLTGACVVALGPYTAGLWSNDGPMLDAVAGAAEVAGEDVWKMPLHKKLKKMLKSDVADMKNVGERWGGAITAALFLEEFVGDKRWVHIDLAGPSYVEKPVDSHVPKGGSGFGVLTLLQYVASRYGA